MTKNDFMIRRLRDKISNYDDFVLYGAGNISQLLIERLAEENIAPLYCVVTDSKKISKTLGEVQIYGLEQKEEELQKKNILVIVAVSVSDEKEILDLLNEKEILNVAVLSKYCCYLVNKMTFSNLYQNKNFEWYLSRIKKWYFEKQGTDLNCQQLLERKSEKGILLVVENLSPRVVKIVRSIKQRNEEITVLLNHNNIANPVYKIFYNYFCDLGVRNYVYQTLEEEFFLILENRGMVTHIFSEPSKIYMPYILVNFQEDIGKIVFESYDIANGFYTELDTNILELERFCLENANGVCYREYSLEYLIDVLHFHIKGNTIRFFDYCSDENIIEEVEEKTGELSICYVGGVITEDDYADCPFGSFMELAKQCEINGCHLHIYPCAWDEKRYKKYIERDKKSSFFHFHKPVDYELLIQELSQYDYGIMPTRDDIWEKETSGYNTKYKYIYAGMNKYFDYLDAGLPIISAIPLKLAEFMEKKGVLLNWTNGQYDFSVMRQKKMKMKKNVKSVKNELKIGNYIDDLLEFYKSL